MLQEKYEFPVLSSQLLGEGKVIKCRETDEEFSPFALSLQKKQIVTVSMYIIKCLIKSDYFLKNEKFEMPNFDKLLLEKPNRYILDKFVSKCILL